MLFIAIKKILKHIFSVFMNFSHESVFASKQFSKLHQNMQPLFETDLLKSLAVT